jgi:hypothetical protein
VPHPFSNRWKKKIAIFQSLEDFSGIFPIVGTFSGQVSNRWKIKNAQSATFAGLRVRSQNGVSRI